MNGWAKVTFACDVPGTCVGAVALASSIVHEKLGRWCERWAPGRIGARSVVPRIAQQRGRTIAALDVWAPVDAIEASRHAGPPADSHVRGETAPRPKDEPSRG